MQNTPYSIFTKRFPQFFKSEHFGFECSEGWFGLLWDFFMEAENHINSIRSHNNYLRSRIDKLKESAPLSDQTNKSIQDLERNLREVPILIIDQIKEKFGTLRLYYSYGDDYIAGLAAAAEKRSESTCEMCGAYGCLRGPGWIKTLCEEHAAALNKQAQKEVQIGSELSAQIEGKSVIVLVTKILDASTIQAVIQLPGTKETNWECISGETLVLSKLNVPNYKQLWTQL